MFYLTLPIHACTEILVVKLIKTLSRNKFMVTRISWPPNTGYVEARKVKVAEG